MCKSSRLKERNQDVEQSTSSSKQHKSYNLLPKALRKTKHFVQFNPCCSKECVAQISQTRERVPSYNASYRKQYRNNSLPPNELQTFTEKINLSDKNSPFHSTSEVLKSKGYSLESKIGKGGYGVVYKIRFKGNVLACKVIDLRRRNRTRLMNHLKMEIFIMERTEHPNIINIMDHFIINDEAYIIMEFADSGSLADLIESRGAISEPLAHYYFVQIVNGIAFLHSCNVAHRDVKLDNILLSLLPDKRKQVKITDFGLSQAAYNPANSEIKSGTYGGTRNYMAPEILRLDIYEEFDSGSTLDYDPFKSDIWAMGVCLYELLTATLPFDYFSTLKHMYEMQMQQQISFSGFILSVSVKDLIRKLLEPNPDLRIDPIGIWAHPWMQSHLIKQSTKQKSN